MGLYTDRILPRLIDRVLDTKDFREIRRVQMSPVSGRVLEVGFGAGPNVPFLPDTVEMLYAVDPATSVRSIADRRLRARGLTAQYVGLDGARLELADESVDHVVSTMTLCTIPDVERALREIHRVLRPGGSFHFVDHGRSPDPLVARRQRRLNGLHGRLFGWMPTRPGHSDSRHREWVGDRGSERGLHARTQGDGLPVSRNSDKRNGPALSRSGVVSKGGLEPPRSYDH